MPETDEYLGRLISDLQQRVLDLERLELALAAEDWTPVITQSGTVTKTVNFARITKIGKLRFVQVNMDVTGAGTIGNAVTISGLPATSQVNVNRLGAVGSFRILNAGTAVYAGTVVANGVDSLIFFAHLETSAVGATPNFALANTDVIMFECWFETA